MPDKEGVANEFDGPWKVALEIYLRPFLGLCFPAVHDLVDWTHAPIFLDTELQALGLEYGYGVRAVDRLVRVRLADGRFEWLFIHVEVQAQRQAQFARRLFAYFYRILDKFGEAVISLAVLADDDPAWRPRLHETEIAGCRLCFEFPMFKVVDFADPEGVFRRTGNPFALIIAAHQVALATARDVEARYRRRFGLLGHLAQLSGLGMSRKEARELWKVIHVLTQLPEDLELKFRAETATVQPMSIKDLITPLERIAMREGEARGEARGAALGQAAGRLEGGRTAACDALVARFGSVPDSIAGYLNTLTSMEELRYVLRLAVTEPNLDAFQRKVLGS